ncbi:MAG TPA: ABC transporter ATP-binding protein [Thermodesulfobacteriota bacterium]|nr:ABC transporter ATP-binding protein [Thermodesulfobacteriota bacterium]
MHLLEVKAIKVLYGKAIALNGLTLSIDEKEMVGVVGPNGAGKSTLLRTISALIPSEGEILFRGDRIDHHPPHEIVRKGIIHCPERRQLFVDFTVAENLEMGYFLRKDKAKIQDDLANVYRLFPVLGERRNQLSGTLSGGEQQMLAIGRALMSSPKLLMLDEPSMGLSPLTKNLLVDGIKTIWESGMTVLIVEQDASLTLNLVERVYILEHGKVGLEGKSRDLMNNEEVKRVYFQLG